MGLIVSSMVLVAGCNQKQEEAKEDPGAKDTPKVEAKEVEKDGAGKPAEEAADGEKKEAEQPDAAGGEKEAGTEAGAKTDQSAEAKPQAKPKPAPPKVTLTTSSGEKVEVADATEALRGMAAALTQSNRVRKGGMVQGSEVVRIGKTGQPSLQFKVDDKREIEVNDARATFTMLWNAVAKQDRGENAEPIELKGRGDDRIAVTDNAEALVAAWLVLAEGKKPIKITPQKVPLQPATVAQGQKGQGQGQGQAQAPTQEQGVADVSAQRKRIQMSSEPVPHAEDIVASAKREAERAAQISSQNATAQMEGRVQAVQQQTNQTQTQNQGAAAVRTLPPAIYQPPPQGR